MRLVTQDPKRVCVCTITQHIDKGSDQDGPLYVLRGHSSYFQKKNTVFLSLKIDFV